MALQTRGLHESDFQPQLQPTPWSWIQIHSTPNSKLNGTAAPIHIKVRTVFYPYRVKILVVLVSNSSTLAHICQSPVYYWDITLFLCYLYHVLWRFDYIYPIVLSRQSAPNPIQSIRFSQIAPHFHPFPLHIHFHMDFHSTEGLYFKLRGSLIRHLPLPLVNMRRESGLNDVIFLCHLQRTYTTHLQRVLAFTCASLLG